MSSTPPRLGPWLRRYDPEPRKTWRDRAMPILIGVAAVLVFGVALFGVLAAFTRFPVATVAALVVIWIVAFGLSLVLRRRSRSSQRGSSLFK